MGPYRKSVFVYRLDSGRLERKIDRQSLGAVPDSFLNDIALDGAGNPFVTDSRDANLVVVSANGLAARLRSVSAVPFGNQNGVKYNLKGSCWLPTGSLCSA